MASNIATKSFLTITRPVRRRPSIAGVSFSWNPTPKARCLTASTPLNRDTTYPTDGPRWQRSPPLMRAPFKHRLTHQTYIVNSDPAELDAFYVRFLGPGGDQILTEEVKWLAVTHKSFDHGSRGFCDRLAFLGMQTGSSLLSRTNAIQGDVLYNFKEISFCYTLEISLQHRISPTSNRKSVRSALRFNTRPSMDSDI
jgi:hypothetical protein